MGIPIVSLLLVLTIKSLFFSEYKNHISEWHGKTVCFTFTFLHRHHNWAAIYRQKCLCGNYFPQSTEKKKKTCQTKYYIWLTCPSEMKKRNSHYQTNKGWGSSLPPELILKKYEKDSSSWNERMLSNMKTYESIKSRGKNNYIVKLKTLQTITDM